MFGFTGSRPAGHARRQDPHAPRGPKVRKLLACCCYVPATLWTCPQWPRSCWDGNPPRTELATIRTHVYHLRNPVGAAGIRRRPDRAAEARCPAAAYALRIEPSQLDATVFTQLLDRGAGCWPRAGPNGRADPALGARPVAGPDAGQRRPRPRALPVRRAPGRAADPRPGTASRGRHAAGPTSRTRRRAARPSSR